MFYFTRIIVICTFLFFLASTASRFSIPGNSRLLIILFLVAHKLQPFREVGNLTLDLNSIGRRKTNPTITL